MKKILFFLFAALAALTSCQKNLPEPVAEPAPKSQSIIFELIPNYATKARKTDWEAGDTVYVFFTGVQSPRHLQLRYDGSVWTSVEVNGETEEEGCLGLQEGDSGIMRAVWLPPVSFGRKVERPSKDDAGREHEFSPDPFYYYLTATLTFEVIGGKVSGAFDMRIPDGFVQFWIEDAQAQTRFDNKEILLLQCDALKVRRLGYISRGYSSVETLDLNYYDESYLPLPGIPYKGGWLFSGILDEQYLSDCGNNFFFLKCTLSTDDSGYETISDEETFFVKGATLQSHSAIILPAEGSSRWQPFGPDKTVEMVKDGVSYGKWHTTNHGSSPGGFSRGNEYDFATAMSLGLVLPTRDQYQALAEHLDWTEVSVASWVCQIISGDNCHLVLPGRSTPYWTAEEANEERAYSFSLVHKNTGTELKSRNLFVRALEGPTSPSFNAFLAEESY